MVCLPRTPLMSLSTPQPRRIALCTVPLVLEMGPDNAVMMGVHDIHCHDQIECICFSKCCVNVNGMRHNEVTLLAENRNTIST